jgi:endonuclease/exonuclease/phosphatase family metal-dependent hydrolase
MRSGRDKVVAVFLLGLGALWTAEALRAAEGPARRAAGSRPSGAPTSIPASAPASAPATQPATFRLASFNVLYENRDLKAVAETIRKADADVVCLQETNDQSEKILREQLGKMYPHATFQSGGGGASGFGILSKTPLRNVKHLPPKFGWFGTHVCEANLAGRAVQLVSAHLTASTPPANASAAEVLRLWGLREAVRAKEIAYILENTDPRLPRLIAGDLNAQPGDSAPRFLKDKGFVDSLASARADHEKVTTWSGSLGGMQLAFRVDYVFHTKDIQSTDCQVLPCAASDHSLVVSTLRWAPACTRPAATGPAAAPRIP